MKFERMLAVIAMVSIVLINVRLVNFFDIKLLYLFALVLIGSAVKSGIRISAILQLFVLILTPWFSIVSVISFTSFFTSYLMWCLTCTFVFIGVPYITEKFDAKSAFFFVISSLYVGIFASSLAIFQFVYNNFIGAGDFFNFFGTWQIHPHYNNYLFGVFRSTSFYIEPSQLGWFSLFFLSLSIFLRVHDLITSRFFMVCATFFLLGLLSSFSSSAYIGLMTLLILTLLLNSKGTAIIKSLFATIVFLFGFLIFDLQRYLYVFRLSSIAQEGTSGYERVIVPVQTLLEVLDVYPFFGRGLGHQDIYDPSLILSGAAVHNSYFGFFTVFGFIGGTIIGIIIVSFLYSRFSRARFSMILLFPILYSYLLTGAFVSLEIPLLMLIALMAISIVNASRDGIVTGFQERSPI